MVCEKRLQRIREGLLRGCMYFTRLSSLCIHVALVCLLPPLTALEQKRRGGPLEELLKIEVNTPLKNVKWLSQEGGLSEGLLIFLFKL